MAGDNVDTSILRENLILTAIKFLSDSNVQRCTTESKHKFLRSKGMTDPEIQKAFERCLSNLPSMTAELMLYQHSRRSWLKDNLLPVVMYSGMAFGAYWIYKKFIERLIFVDEEKKKATDESISKLKQGLDTLTSEMLAVRSDLDRLGGQQAVNSSVGIQIEQLKTDIASVKGILLNRNQFPSLKTRTSPPSIPAWQQQSAGAEVGAVAREGGSLPHSPPHSPPRSRSQRSQSGGSNSSGEHATKNSDSSLEIIS